MELPIVLFEKYNHRVAVHYGIFDNRNLIHFGTSRVCGNGHSKNTIHAEELALKYIAVLRKKKKKTNKLNIVIWRFCGEMKAKSAFCCKSCTKLIKKYEFERNIFTIDNFSKKMISALLSNPKLSLGNIIRHTKKIDIR